MERGILASTCSGLMGPLPTCSALSCQERLYCTLIPPLLHYLSHPFLPTSHSLSFCKQQHLYGRYAFAGRKVACQSASFSWFLLILGYDPCRRKTSTTLRGKRRVRSIFLRAKPETLMNAVDKKCAIKQCRARIYVCAPQTGIRLILYVRPTSDSEIEEAKGDSSGAMAPPPVPPAKKVRV